ncbi:hypothetical protein [Pseudonocardia sp. TRM90224]|uniref:hypothetical protein n=1 Tax=Pseudonocardia sp. TRM90224 TaxID=2812678 RepID=UPI001E4753DE|nr:hypothetical protein [Pseudonocardia sp. TRM90224]
MSTTTFVRNIARASLGLVVAGLVIGTGGTAFADTSTTPLTPQPGPSAGSWEDATAVLTDRAGKQTTVKATSFHFCSNVVGDDITLSERQTVPFEKTLRIDVVHSDEKLTTDGKADLAVTLLDGQQLAGTVSSNCDFSGDSSIGRFNIYPEDLKFVEFKRGAETAPAPGGTDGPATPDEVLTVSGSLGGTVEATSVTCTRLAGDSWSWLLEGSVDGTPVEITFNTNNYKGAGDYNATGVTDEAGGLVTLTAGEVQVVTNGATTGKFTVAADEKSGSIDAALTSPTQEVRVVGSWLCS